MAGPQEPQTTPPPAEGKQSPRSRLREVLRRRYVKSALVFAITLIIDKVVALFFPESVQRLQQFNEQLAEGVRAVQPWYGAALFLEKLTANLTPDAKLIGPGGIIGAAFLTVADTLADPQNALPAAVGYGLGLYVVWKVHEHAGKELNFLVGLVGMIFVGSLCLLVLQPIMYAVTQVFGKALGFVSTNLAALASVASLGPELTKHVLEGRAEAALDRALEDPKPDDKRDPRQPELPWTEKVERETPPPPPASVRASRFAARALIVTVLAVVTFPLWRGQVSSYLPRPPAPTPLPTLPPNINFEQFFTPTPTPVATPTPRPLTPEERGLVGTRWVGNYGAGGKNKLELTLSEGRRIRYATDIGLGLNQLGSGEWQLQGDKISATFPPTMLNESRTRLSELLGTIAGDEIRGKLFYGVSQRSQLPLRSEEFVARRVR